MLRGGAINPSSAAKGEMKLNKNSKKTINRVMRYIMDDYKARFIMVLFFIAFSALATVAAALFLEILIESYIVPLTEQANPDFTPLFHALVIMGIIYLAGVTCAFLFHRIMVSISNGVQRRVRDQLFTHMQKLPTSYFDKHPHGDLMSRFSNDVDALRNFLGQSIPVVFSALISLVVTLIAMLFMSPLLTLVVLLMAVLSLVATAKLGKTSGKYFGEQQKDIGLLNAHIEEMMGNPKVVKVFNHEAQSIEKFNKLNKNFEKTSGNANKYAYMFMPLMVNMSTLQYLVIAVVGGFLSISGITPLTIGTIAAFLQLSRAFSTPLANLSMQINGIIMALAGATRIFEIMDEPVEEDNGHITLTKTDAKTWAWHDEKNNTTLPMTGNVVLSNVTFGYSEEKTILKAIDLYAKPGQKIAIVGATGAGKTTITNLINRFYDIQDGSITYDGIDIKDIKKDHLRRSLGMVLQDTNLFTDTIRENIRYGNLDATDQAVIDAAKLANAHSFIELLSDGYDTVLTDAGAELSAGQRQLISIARAAVANPPVMILDEATSSIDTRTELIVQKGMDSLMQGHTVFVIAHRLSTIKNANLIVVMDAGEIIEKGDHQELMAKKGRYYDMYTGGLLEIEE